jgi:hypothetical protein
MFQVIFDSETECILDLDTAIKLGYNEIGYNVNSVITNKMNTAGWFQSFRWNIFSIITNKTLCVTDLNKLHLAMVDLI